MENKKSLFCCPICDATARSMEEIFMHISTHETWEPYSTKGANTYSKQLNIK